MATVQDLAGLRLLVYDVPKDAFPEVRRRVDPIVRQQLNRDNRRYVTVGGRRYELKVNVRRPTRQGPRTLMVMEPVPAGFWSWAEDGTSSHRIVPRDRRALLAGSGRYERPVRYDGGQLGVVHPGFRGRKSLTKTMGKIRDEWEEICVETLVRQVRRLN